MTTPRLDDLSHLKTPETEAELTAKVPVKDPKTQKVWTFPFSYASPAGTFEGTFVHTVPTVGQEIKIGALRARLTDGMPVESLDAYTRNLVEAVAYLSITLATDGRPSWANDLLAVSDPNAVLKLFEEAASHDATFRRG